MRLLAVRLQNLNSLSGTHEVRFDEAPLNAAGVFLITGPTGAGKSTLLDAMTLALYGRAARYGNEKADEMMSRQATECYAEVDFETGGRHLRSTWRLGKTKTGNLKPVQRTLADALTGEILADKGREVDPMIESFTGLDVQRFLRSVLLAQGQFAAFLKAKPNERAELLERITGTEIYRSLSIRAHETYRTKEEQVSKLKASLGAVTVLEEEARAALETTLAQTRTVAEELNAQKDRASTQLHAQREHAQIVKDLAHAADTLTQLQQAEGKTTQAVKRDHDACEEAKRQRALREPIWEQVAGMAAQSEQYEKQLEESRANYKEWAKQQLEAKTKLEAAEKALKSHVQTSQALETWLREHAEDRTLGESLPALSQGIRLWRSAHEKLSEGRTLHEEAQTQKQRLTELEGQISTLTDQLTAITTQAQQARAEQERLTQALTAQRALEEQAQLVASFEEHRDDLAPGQPCPLCGATEHPYLSGSLNADSQLHTARKLRAALEKQSQDANQRFSKSEREQVKLEAELKAETKRRDELHKTLAAIRVPDLPALEAQEIQARQSLTFPASKSKFSPQHPNEAEQALDDLQLRASTFTRQQQTFTLRQQERQKIETDISLFRQDETDKTKRMEELKAEGISLRSKADALKAQLNTLLGQKTLQEDRQQHDRQVASLEKAWRDSEAVHQQLQNNLAAAKAKQEQLEQRRQPFAQAPVPTPESLQELSTQVQQLTSLLAQKHTELGTLSQQLRHDDEARQRRDSGGAELKAAEEEALRWGRLRELIGSADGAKFSRFAQSLTLRQLIGLANEHLQVLAERYRLIAAPGDDLDLRIVDLYQANADRPMESLSGGESFLASLALALGLSELASHHHPIDSLFIDEGFGTLDSETLEIALSALENLRSRGKTIGLISHVELLKERLTTQIQVTKLTGGSSQLKVVS
ncbi:exonuclease SbcC [Prosthecobacter debontii]|uniref:Exonuclease SbcC n=1 Tax=Prosthecobacter debontii TaxID=48467 RepID=A0A1T4WGA8_9BACT|nr:AAA family ATPase [Prosthecobacter debontii]SKA76364.1 exonuclease SbcC [Prosthecobacter debontii]